MTRIEKAVREVSDLYDFYRRIPKIKGRNEVRESKHKAMRADQGPAAADSGR